MNEIWEPLWRRLFLANNKNTISPYSFLLCRDSAKLLILCYMKESKFRVWESKWWQNFIFEWTFPLNSEERMYLSHDQPQSSSPVWREIEVRKRSRRKRRRRGQVHQAAQQTLESTARWQAQRKRKRKRKREGKKIKKKCQWCKLEGCLLFPACCAFAV